MKLKFGPKNYSHNIQEYSWRNEKFPTLTKIDPIFSESQPYLTNIRRIVFVFVLDRFYFLITHKSQVSRTAFKNDFQMFLSL